MDLKKIEQAARFFAEKTSLHPASIHIDTLGLLRIPAEGEGRLKYFQDILQFAEEMGANILIPSYSYSFCDKEIFDIANSPSKVGNITDFLRKTDFTKRTADGIFSYLLYSKSLFKEFLRPIDYECFGRGGLIDALYHKDGFLCGLGCGLRMLTEIYYLENMMKVQYRFNKVFKGEIIDLAGHRHQQSLTYFVRRLELGLGTNFVRMQQDLRASGSVDIWRITDELQIEAVRFSKLEVFLRKKVADNPLYLTQKVT